MAGQFAGAHSARLRRCRDRAVGDRRRGSGGLCAVRPPARRRRPAAAAGAALQRRPRARRDRRARCGTRGRARPGAHGRGHHAAVRRAQAAVAAAARARPLGSGPPRRGLVRLARGAACRCQLQRTQLGARERSLRFGHTGLRARSVRGGRHRGRPLRPHPRPGRRRRRRERGDRREHPAPRRHSRRRRSGRSRLVRVRRRSRPPWRPARQAGRLGRRAGLQRPPVAGRPSLSRRTPRPRPLAAQRLHGERRLRSALVPARAGGRRGAGGTRRRGGGDTSRRRRHRDAAVPPGREDAGQRPARARRHRGPAPRPRPRSRVSRRARELRLRRPPPPRGAGGARAAPGGGACHERRRLVDTLEADRRGCHWRSCSSPSSTTPALRSARPSLRGWAPAHSQTGARSGASSPWREPIAPRSEHTAVYEQGYRAYRALYEAIKPAT